MPRRSTVLRRYTDLRRGLKLTIFFSLLAFGIAYLNYSDLEWLSVQQPQIDYVTYKAYFVEQTQMINLMIFFGSVLAASILALDVVVKRTPSK